MNGKTARQTVARDATARVRARARTLRALRAWFPNNVARNSM